MEGRLLDIQEEHCEPLKESLGNNRLIVNVAERLAKEPLGVHSRRPKLVGNVQGI